MRQSSSRSISFPMVLALVVIGCLVVIGGIIALIFIPLRFNAGLVDGIAIVKKDPAVAQMFGTPIRQGLFVKGSLLEYKYGDGSGSLTTTIYGPKGKGDVSFFVSKPGNRNWQLDSMSIHVGRELVLVWDADKAGIGFRTYQKPPDSIASPTPAPVPTAVP